MEKDITWTINQNKVGMAILLLGKIHFTSKTAWPTK